MFSENNPNFSFEDCSFLVQKNKDGCSRVAMWREFNLVNSFTCEASFCGPTKGPHAHCHFNTSLLEQVGASFCITLFDMTTDGDRYKRTLQDLQQRFSNNNNKKNTFIDDDAENEEEEE